jgi:organic radical activating enzyme
MSSDFFCPAPWNSMYYHVDNASPCHTNKNGMNFTPQEYLKSDLLKSMKKDFLEGRVPLSCTICKNREDLGIKSTRQSTFVTPEGKQINFDRSKFTEDAETKVTRLELRLSNLCNFKCRMCNAFSSSEIAREIKEFPILAKHSGENIVSSTIDSIEELKKIALDGIRVLCFTGGEPLLIKSYYDFLDLLIEKGYNENIIVEIFSNCSVYNPIFIEKLYKFKKVRFVMSIDGVGKTAEYQRKGTNWSVVEKNLYKYTQLPEPFTPFFNTAISPYVLLDVSSLAKFLMELYEMNNALGAKCYSTVKPEALHFRNMDKHSRSIAIEQIDKAVKILNVDNFYIFKKELLNIKKNLVENEPSDPNLFFNFTRILDAIRNEKFEEVFGYKLTPP